MAVAHESQAIAEHINLYRSKHMTGNRLLSLSKTAAQFGVSRETLNAWMTGLGTPTLKKACRVADVLGISLDELVGRA